MEIFKRLKELIPTVRASEPNASDVSDDVHQVKPVEKKPEINLADKAGYNSDILIERESSYQYYPERPHGRYKPSLYKKVVKFEGREEFTRVNCEKKIHKLSKEDPLVRLLIGALKSAGCDIDLRRNFSCEVCYAGVCGGYDTKTQQVVMCMNNVSSENQMATILTHELIHMYDHCVNDTDFTIAEHLACTEIRAINLTSCSLIDSFFSGYVSTMELLKKDYGQKHSLCVKERALQSVMAASTSMNEQEARRVIDKVFPYCYKDLEPIGRRLRDRSEDNNRAYLDGKHYGYV